MRDEKLLIIIANDELRQTIVMHMNEYFKCENIYLSTNEKDALWQASVNFPDYIIMFFMEKNMNSHELLTRMRRLNSKIKGLIIFDSESNDYEVELNNIISNDFIYKGLRPVNLMKISEQFREIFNI